MEKPLLGLPPKPLLRFAEGTAIAQAWVSEWYYLEDVGMVRRKFLLIARSTGRYGAAFIFENPEKTFKFLHLHYRGLSRPQAQARIEEWLEDTRAEGVAVENGVVEEFPAAEQEERMTRLAAANRQEVDEQYA